MSRQRQPAQESDEGGKRGKRIEPTSQACIPSAMIRQYREVSTVKKKSKLLDTHAAATDSIARTPYGSQPGKFDKKAGGLDNETLE